MARDEWLTHQRGGSSAQSRHQYQTHSHDTPLHAFIRDAEHAQVMSPTLLCNVHGSQLGSGVLRHSAHQAEEEDSCIGRAHGFRVPVEVRLRPQRGHHKGNECVLYDPAQRAPQSHAMLNASQLLRYAQRESADMRRCVRVSRGHMYQPVHALLWAWWAVWAGGRAAPEEVGEAVAPHQDPLAVRASLEHVPGPQRVSAHGINRILHDPALGEWEPRCVSTYHRGASTPALTML